MKQAFFIIFKGPSMKQITRFFLEGESPTLTDICLKKIHKTLAVISVMDPCFSKLWNISVNYFMKHGLMHIL